MKICMLTSEFPPDLGGISAYTYNLSERLIERGHSVTVITRGMWRRKTYHEVIDGISVYRVRFIPFYPDPFRLHGLFVSRLFKRIEPELDLLHMHGSILPVIDTRLPTVVTAHGTVARDIDNMPVKSFHFLVVRLLRKKLLNAEEAILKSADVITVVSRSCAEELREYHTIDQEIIVVNNGVDTDFFIPVEDKGKDDYILYAGRLETRKGLTDFIESAGYVCLKNPGIRFVVAGKGTIKDYLEQRITELGLNKNFYFAGFVGQSRLRGYYQNATIHVIPSYYEGLPTTLLEAMSCATPSIATDVEGNSELIIDGENGLLVPPRDPEKLAEAMLKLLADEGLREKIGVNARTHVISCYSWDIVADKVEEAYEKAFHEGVG